MLGVWDFVVLVFLGLLYFGKETLRNKQVLVLPEKGKYSASLIWEVQHRLILMELDTLTIHKISCF